MRAEQYRFRPAMMEDLALLRNWQQRPHVREWWDDGEPFDQEELEDPRVARWIVTTNGGKPFAYMQDYTVHGWDNHHFDYLPVGARGIDQYIGEPEMTGCGHGSALILQRMQALFEANVPVIATDPSPENKRAIAVYTKLGFRVAGPIQKTDWGVIFPMECQKS